MKRILILFTSVLLSVSCGKSATNYNTENNMQGHFSHVVYFWLKNPNNQKDRDKFEASLKSFINQSEFIKTKFIGTPASTNRGVIDNSYTYSLVLSFENKAMQDKYQEEPNHKKFITECEVLWKKVIVYDSVNFLE